jgi:hypothetical protein
MSDCRALAAALRANDIDRACFEYFKQYWGKNNPAIEESFAEHQSALGAVDEARTRLKRKEFFPWQEKELKLIASTRL